MQPWNRCKISIIHCILLDATSQPRFKLDSKKLSVCYCAETRYMQMQQEVSDFHFLICCISSERVRRASFCKYCGVCHDRISVSLVWLSRSVCWRCLLLCSAQLCAALLWMCSLILKPKHGRHLTRLWQCKYVPNTYKEAIFCMLFVHLDIIKNNKIMKSEESFYVVCGVFFAQWGERGWKK